jgi:hypothetical protein
VCTRNIRHLTYARTFAARWGAGAGRPSLFRLRRLSIAYIYVKTEYYELIKLTNGIAYARSVACPVRYVDEAITDAGGAHNI